MQFVEAKRIEHQALADHFSNLAGARGDLPVFVIEHNLGEAALASLRAAVNLQLEVDPQLQGAVWAWSYLPLLVMATEVGYRYRGTGTDFWPVLSLELGVETGLGFRAGISRLFELGHRTFRLARPGGSAWERHFPHIAWPIGNAVVPLEIQPQLTDALRRAIRAGISAENTEALLDHLKMLAAGHASRRFENWLQRGEIGLEVMRRLLSPNSEGWLSQGILRRIDDDIRADLGSFHAITEARRTVVRRSTRITELPTSQFVMSLLDGKPEQMLIRGPTLPLDLRDEVVAALRIQGDRLRAVGTDQSILLRHFLAGGEIAMGSISALPEDPLRRGDALQVAPGLASTVLAKLQPQDAAFFLIEPGEHAAHAIFPKEALAPDGAVLQRLRIGDDDLPDFRRLEMSIATDAALLRKHGFSILERQPALRLLGVPMPGSQSRFATGFPILAAPLHAGPFPLLNGAQPSLGSVHLRGVDWAVFRPDAGGHWLGPAAADDHEMTAFQVIEPPDLEPASVNILPAGATMADLIGGTLEIVITSPLALETVPIRLRVSAANQPDILSESTIDRLPVRIGGRAPLLQSLRAQLAERHGEMVGVRLAVEVRGLLPAGIVLPPVRRDLRYERAFGQWISESDGGRILPSLVATPRSTLPHATGNEVTGFRLIIPDAPDHEALGAGIVSSGNATLRFGGQETEVIALPLLLREARLARRQGRSCRHRTCHTRLAAGRSDRPGCRLAPQRRCFPPGRCRD